jgi:hypothetical protein
MKSHNFPDLSELRLLFIIVFVNNYLSEFEVRFSHARNIDGVYHVLRQKYTIKVSSENFHVPRWCTHFFLKG